MIIPASEFVMILPEIFVLSMACIILVLDLFLKQSERNISYWLTQLTLVFVAVITLSIDTGETQLLFFGTYIFDPMGTVLKVFIFLVTGLVFMYSRHYLRDRGLFKGEFYVLGLFGMLGMMVMVSAHSLLTIYLGLELLSLSLYAMVAFNRDSYPCSEAAMKYFVLGAIASGMLLYGMSMLYGLTGTLDIGLMADTLGRQESTVPLVFATVFIVVGLAFKLGAVPFHMWVPDVYQGAPTPVTQYIGSASKIAAFAMVMRLLAEAVGPLQDEWQGMLIVLAVLSLGIGNVVAIAQTNLKRMLAYSTISHVGFLLLGILAGTSAGYSAAMFYIITYSLMAAGAFGMIILLSRAGFEADEIEDFKGLNQRNPWFALVMLILMFSMAGVPPTVGFYAKLSVLQAVIDLDMVWLAGVAVFFSVIGAFYYIRLIKVMYFDDATDDQPLSSDFDLRFGLSANGLAILFLGLFPGSLMALCSQVIP
ncbi:NADH-ubiquinone oxidoreductase chain N [hydrothermal vent metagenome]|uniref:NADH-ubiquinone oxidoreductase chain N n=1 Tax=hydrothermal vent metagenome TaxID=652676 RepID=A0A3B0YIC2_9ZZZZ